MRWSITVYVGAALWWLPGCGPSPDENGGRRIADLRDTVWVRVAGATDTVLLNPIALAAGDGRLYVADLGARRIVALDSRSGDLLWTFGREGGGPGEFTAPASLALLPDGGVVVGDRVGGRITIVSREGQLVALHAPPLPDVHAICAVSPRQALAYSAGSSAPFGLVDLETGSAIQLHTPWPAFDSLSAVVRQVNLSSSMRASDCWMTMIAIGHFARYVGDRFEPLRGYVEPVPFPEVHVQTVTDAQGRVRSRRERLARRPAAAQAAAAYADELFVLFAGQSEDAHRIIDVYQAPGVYRGSFRLGRSARAIGADDETLFVLTTMAGPDASEAGGGYSYPAVVALRIP